MVHAQHLDVVLPHSLGNVLRKQIGMNAHILNHRQMSGLCPFLPGRLDAGKRLAFGTDPGVVNVIPQIAFSKMQVYACPVGKLCIVDAYRARPAPQLRQRAVGSQHFFVVSHGNLREPCPQSHPFRQKVAVFLRPLFPAAVFLFRLLQQRRKVLQAGVCHVPVQRIVHHLHAGQAADKGKEAVVRLVFKKDPAPLRQLVIQRAVIDMAVGGKVTGTGIFHFALSGDKDLDVVVGLILVDFVENDLAGAHTVTALGVVGASLHHAFVFPTLDQLFGVVIVLVQLAFPLGALQNLQQILDRPRGLLLIVGTDIHVIPGAFAVRRNGAGAVKSDQAVLAGTASHHAKEGVPAGHPVRGVCTIPQRDHELLPGKQLERKVPLQPHVFFQLRQIHRQVFFRKALSDVGHQGVLLGTGSGVVRLHQLDVFQDLRRQVTAHRQRHRPWAHLT